MRPNLAPSGELVDFDATEPKGGSLYEDFFGLKERPFDLVPNPRFLFLTDVQREALSTLRYGLSGPGGITLLLGDAGTGKTTLVRTALSGLGDDRVQCLLLSNPTLKREEFYESLAQGFGLRQEASRSKATFLSAFQEHAAARLAGGRITAIMLDEAQSLPDELLEEVRLLSNLETSTAKLLNVVLAGQPELGARLNHPRLRQLKQRLVLRCALRPFTLVETASYIAGRLRIAGGVPVEIFTREAVGRIFEASSGIPRVVNVIGENALIGGFANQVKPVPRAIVEEVIRDFDLGTRVPEDDQPNPFPAIVEAPTAEAVVGSREPEPTAPNRTSRFRFFGGKRRSSASEI